jgi:dolichol-phosphate mannosyltransferase
VSGLSGLNLICLGIVGEYVGRIHEQVKHRPLYLVKERIGFETGRERANAA